MLEQRRSHLLHPCMPVLTEDSAKRWSRLLQKTPEIPGLVAVKPVEKRIVEDVDEDRSVDDDGPPETSPASPRKKPKTPTRRKPSAKPKGAVKSVKEKKTAVTEKRPSKKRKVEKMEEVKEEEEESSEGDGKNTEEGEDLGYETEKGEVKEGEDETEARKEVEMVDAEAAAVAVDMSVNMGED